MKTIGVLGGLGPQATYDFERRLHLAAQQLIPPDGNSGYPPLVVLYFRHPPVRVKEDGQPVRPIEPNPLLAEAASRLATISDFIVIPSNGVHLLQSYIEQASGKKVLSIIDLTLAEVERLRLKKVGVLEFVGTGIYQVPLRARDIPFVTIPQELQIALDHAIHDYWEGKHSDEQTEVTLWAVEALRKQGTDGIILGCTELPLLLGDHAHAPDLINPAQLLAEAAVRHAIQE
ncbi:MAG: amino acid racemase [Chloroflexia bacterium]